MQIEHLDTALFFAIWSLVIIAIVTIVMYFIMDWVTDKQETLHQWMKEDRQYYERN